MQLKLKVVERDLELPILSLYLSRAGMTPMSHYV